MISLRKRCAKCDKILGDVPYTTEDERLKLATSVVYCDDCGITNAIVDIFKKHRTPYKLTKAEREILEEKELEKIEKEGTKYHKLFFRKTHPKPKIRKLAKSQSSIDDFV